MLWAVDFLVGRGLEKATAQRLVKLGLWAAAAGVLLAAVAYILILRAEVKAAHADLATCDAQRSVDLASIDKLQAAIDDQNKRIVALGEAADQRQREGQAALAEAQKASAKAEDMARSLEASAARVVKDAPCRSSDAVMKLKGVS